MPNVPLVDLLKAIQIVTSVVERKENKTEVFVPGQKTAFG